MSITYVNISDKEFFDACLNVESKDRLLSKHKLIIDGEDKTLSQFRYEFSDKCRFCKGQLNKNNITKVSSYWYIVTFPCHKECKVVGSSQEAYDCQLIDADCNWCKYFQRDGRGMEGGVGRGHCSNYIFDSTETICQSNSYAGNFCFEHRRKKFLNISVHKLNFIKKQALKDTPNETAGVLLGENGEVKVVVSLKNISESPEKEYKLENLNFDATKNPYGYDIIGIYHSHPTTHAYASEKDIEYFFPGLAYLIYSIKEDKFTLNRRAGLLVENQEFK